jgi:hypothetical protein
VAASSRTAAGRRRRSRKIEAFINVTYVIISAATGREFISGGACKQKTQPSHRATSSQCNSVRTIPLVYRRTMRVKGEGHVGRERGNGKKKKQLRLTFLSWLH